MNYKETLFFIGKCLTITKSKENINEVTNLVKNKAVDWDNVVKVSTTHYVFPALYMNLERKQLTSYLPEELVQFMKHITNLNKERNKTLILEAYEINNLLLNNGIQPIFLKGTGNLLNNLYEDISERMVGDIDIIVSNNDYDNCIELLKSKGYDNDIKIMENAKLGKHYPRMNHPKKNMAIEVHFKILKDNFSKNLDYKTLFKNTITVNDSIRILNSKYQSLHTIFNKQINDLGYWHKTVSLRNLYDIFLLSNNVNTLTTIKKISNHFNIANTFLASASYFLNTQKIKYQENLEVQKFIKKQEEFLENPNKQKSNIQKWNLFFNSKTRIKKLKMAFYNKEVRNHLKNLIKTKLNG